MSSPKRSDPAAMPRRRSRLGVVLIILFCLLLALATILVLLPVLRSVAAT